jgi:hypothetical protein
MLDQTRPDQTRSDFPDFEIEHRLNQTRIEQAIRELIKEHNLVPIGLKLINRTSSVYLESQDIIVLSLCNTYS